jgi:hypothetical protein
MLARVPAVLPGLDMPLDADISYADLATQLATVGVTPPAGVDGPEYDRWFAAIKTLPLPSSAGPYGTFARDDYGFDLLQADRTLMITLPPFSLVLLEGRFDEAAVHQALNTAGYQPVDVDGHELLALRGDLEQDLSAPPAFRMSNMNFAVILDDGTLAFASAGAPLAAVLDVTAGTTPTMAELPGMPDLITNLPAELVAATLVSGANLSGRIPDTYLDAVIAGATPDVAAIATEVAATAVMPPVVMAVLGFTAGGPLVIDDAPAELPRGTPEARAVAVLLLPGVAAAQEAGPIVSGRLATGSAANELPYTQVFSTYEVHAVESAPVVVVDLALGTGVAPNILFRMYVKRDLGFLAW